MAEAEEERRKLRKLLTKAALGAATPKEIFVKASDALDAEISREPGDQRQGTCNGGSAGQRSPEFKANRYTSKWSDDGALRQWLVVQLSSAAHGEFTAYRLGETFGPARPLRLGYVRV